MSSMRLCLPSIVDSGVFLSADPRAGVPQWVRDARRISGVIQVHFGSEALRGRSITDALLRNSSTLSRWVDVPSWDEAGTITRADADERTKAHGLPVDLAGRADLLDPYDDRILPINDGHEIVRADLATGVRIVPELYLLDCYPDLEKPASISSDGQVPSQLRLHGHTVQLGLVADVAGELYANVNAIPQAPQRMAVAGSYPDLLGYLNSRPAGSWTSVQAVSADGDTTFPALAISGRSGPAVLQETVDGITAALPFPREFAALRYAPLPVGHGVPRALNPRPPASTATTTRPDTRRKPSTIPLSAEAAESDRYARAPRSRERAQPSVGPAAWMASDAVNEAL